MVRVSVSLNLRNPGTVALHEPTLLAAEVVVLVLAYATFRHARSYGRKPLAVWVAALLHGFCVEVVTKMNPRYEVTWHAQSTIMLNDKRTPLYALFLHAVVIYMAWMTVMRLRFRPVPRCFAVGIATVILQAPFEIVGSKFLWWSFHDTDPHLMDRTFDAPWSTLISQLTYGFMLSLLFYMGSSSCGPSQSEKGTAQTLRYIPAILLAGLLSLPLSTLLMVGTFHALHDPNMLALHGEVCFHVNLLMYGLVMLLLERGHKRTYIEDAAGVRKPHEEDEPPTRQRSHPGALGGAAGPGGRSNESPPNNRAHDPRLGRVSAAMHLRTSSDSMSVSSSGSGPSSPTSLMSSGIPSEKVDGMRVERTGSRLLLTFDSYKSTVSEWVYGPRHVYADGLVLCVLLFFASTAAIAYYGVPEDVVSLGYHQEIGDCLALTEVLTPFNVLQRRTYLCVSDFYEHFGFACADVPEGQPRWFTICGVPHHHPTEFKTVVISMCLGGLAAFVIVLRSHVNLQSFSNGEKPKNE